MKGALTTSVGRKLLAVILATTAVTLAFAAGAILLFEVYAYQKSRVNDLTAQAELLALASAPTFSFNDPAAARENLEMLRLRPQVRAAALYTLSGGLFATYVQANAVPATFPEIERQKVEMGVSITRGEIAVFHPVLDNGERVGTVYLRARYDLADRVRTYAAIIGVSMLGSMLIALLVAARLQKTFTEPLFEVTKVAHRIVASRDFSLRANKTTGDEIGLLVDAFNDMLREIGLRAQALEDSNRALAQEMDVRRAAESKLRLADRRKDEFLAMLAHELRNPLAPISAAAQILRIGRLDETRTRQTSELIARQVEHMTSLVNDLLDVSRVTRGLIVLERASLDLKHIVLDAVEQVRPLLSLRQHELVQEISARTVYVVGDHKRLVQVLANLLNNAAKYTPVGGRIALSLTVEGEQAVLCVQDNGIGMDAELQNNVFELFTQAQRSSDRSLGGLGLGLALVKNIVELHGGSVTAHSEGDGKGSIFTVRLPLSAPPAAREDARRAPESQTKTGALRLLVVDDNRDAADSLAVLLETAGHEVKVEYGSQAALDCVAQWRPQVCLLDIGLPGMDGHQLARAIRALPGMEQTVLIAVTGYGQRQDRDTALEAGFNHHLVKPVETRALLALLERIAHEG